MGPVILNVPNRDRENVPSYKYSLDNFSNISCLIFYNNFKFFELFMEREYRQLHFRKWESLILNLADCIHVECLSISRIERLVGIKWSYETAGRKYSRENGNQLSSAYESGLLKPIFRTIERKLENLRNYDKKILKNSYKFRSIDRSQNGIAQAL